MTYRQEAARGHGEGIIVYPSLFRIGTTNIATTCCRNNKLRHCYRNYDFVYFHGEVSCSVPAAAWRPEMTLNIITSNELMTAQLHHIQSRSPPGADVTFCVTPAPHYTIFLTCSLILCLILSEI